MEEEKTIEDIKRESVLEKIQMPKLVINGKEEEPNLIICANKKQIKIFMNQGKVYRTINHSRVSSQKLGATDTALYSPSLNKVKQNSGDTKCKN